MPRATTENILHSYLAAIERELQQGIAREHSYRPALKTLIETLYPGTLATNEPKRIRCGVMFLRILGSPALLMKLACL
jgi:hypothetical protein